MDSNAGTLPADGAQDLTFTITVPPTMTPGVYTATLLLRTTDFRAARITLPVTLTVVGPELTVGIVGSGTVLQEPLPPYSLGDVVTLTAEAELDWRFTGWSGNLSGDDPVGTLTLDGHQAVTATFAFEGPDPYLIKGVMGRTWPGGEIAYHLVLANRGLGDALTVVLTDVLPAEVTFGAFLENAGGATYDAGAVSWSGTLPAQDTLTLRFSAYIADDDQLVDAVITNTATFNSANAGTGSATAVFTVQPLYRVYLPCVLRE